MPEKMQAISAYLQQSPFPGQLHCIVSALQFLALPLTPFTKPVQGNPLMVPMCSVVYKNTHSLRGQPINPFIAGFIGQTFNCALVLKRTKPAKDLRRKCLPLSPCATSSNLLNPNPFYSRDPATLQKGVRTQYNSGACASG